MKVISVIQKVINRAVEKAYQSYAFYQTVKKAVQKFVSELPSFGVVATKMIDVPAYPVAEAIYIKHKVEKNLVQKAKIKELYSSLTLQLMKRKEIEEAKF